MTAIPLFNERFYLLGSRALTHGVFWLVYYVGFSLLWFKPEVGLFGAFYLEFVLLPARLVAVYAMIYGLMPVYLLARRFRQFFLSYAALMVLVGVVQVLAYHFFYQRLFLGQEGSLWDLGLFARSITLVNSTVIFVAAVKLLQIYLNQPSDRSAVAETVVEIRANRRIHLVDAEKILYVEGMGNYVSYHLAGGEKLIAHGSIKAALQNLPSHFLRLHRSYVVNARQIESFGNEDVKVGGVSLPRGKDIEDSMLGAG